MAIVIPGRRQKPPQDIYAITPVRTRGLAELVYRPTLHTQRFVEQASFAPTGGQRWVRQLQVQIPESTESSGITWWVVPLGPFARRRFPDISVTDAAGQRINFVTRKQHGVALAKVALSKHLTGISLPDEPDSATEQPDALAEQYEDFRKHLLDFYTDIGDSERWKERREALLQEFEELLAESGVQENDQEQRLKRFSDDLVKASDTTQYLCWVQAEPGEVINLHVRYSTRDPKHKLEDGRHRSVRGMAGAGWTGLFGWLTRTNLAKRQDTWNRWYVQFGLAPIPYVFNIPTYEYTASHYSTLEPPDNTYVAYLDWELGNSLDSRGEVDSSLDATHIFNNESKNLGRQPTTHAYLRCTPHHHKQILGVALLNIALVWLLAAERFPVTPESPIQGILVAAPSVLIAFLAQQQRHYYAHALRRSRIILWAYLAVEIIFLMGVTFSHAPSSLGWRATDAAWALAISSAMLFAWQFPLGYGYDGVVNWLAKRKGEMVWLRHPQPNGPKRRIWKKAVTLRWSRRVERCGRHIWYKVVALRWSYSAETLWQCYEVAVEQWARWMRRFILGTGFAAFIALCLLWPPKKVIPTLAGKLPSMQRAPVTHTQPSPTHPAPAGNRRESTAP